MKSNMNILNFFNGILQLIIYQDLHIFILFIFDSHVLISISSLMTCLLAQERDNNLSLAWDQPIANHNHPNYPINAWWTKSSPTRHLILFKKPFHMSMRQN